jgi:hypothetical protein
MIRRRAAEVFYFLIGENTRIYWAQSWPQSPGMKEIAR